VSKRKELKRLRKGIERIDGLVAKAYAARVATVVPAPAPARARPARPEPVSGTAGLVSKGGEDEAMRRYAEHVLKNGTNPAMKAEAARVLAEMGGPDEYALLAKARAGAL
jgi:hypothetical protein